MNLEPIDWGVDLPAGGDACCGLPASLRLSGSEAEEIAALFKAIGHPVRVQIVDLLSRYGGQVCVCEIERHFDLAQPTISHHLKTLRAAGLINCEKRGVWYYYFIETAAVARLAELLDGVLARPVAEVPSA